MSAASPSLDSQISIASQDFVVVDEIQEDQQNESFNWDEMQVIDEYMGESPSNFGSLDEDFPAEADHNVQFGGGRECNIIDSESDLEVIDEDDFYNTFQQNSLFGLLQDTQLQTYGPKNDLLIYLRNLTNHLEVAIKKILNQKKGIKFWVSLKVSYTHPAKPEQLPAIFHLHTGQLLLLNEFQLPDILDDIKSKILQRNAHFIKEQSGLVLEKIHSARLRVSEYLPLAGQSYSELPQYLARKQAIINVNNTDNRCFGYALLSAFMSRGSDPRRHQYYERYFQQYGLAELTYPVSPNDIPLVEDQLRIAINVFSFYDDEGRARYPIYISRKKYAQTIDLLYWEEHFAWIKSFSRFMAGISKNGHKLHWCKRCLCHFTCGAALETHQLYCRRIDFSDIIYTMPPEGSKLKFKHYR